MKISDDYHAKVGLWCRQPGVATPPPGPTLPQFKAQKFRTHADMNRWNQELLREMWRIFASLNALLKEDLDLPLVPLGPQGENLMQTYQTRWRVVQYLGLPGVPRFDEPERQAVIRQNEMGTPVPWPRA